jgi:thymidylate kinase
LFNVQKNRSMRGNHTNHKERGGYKRPSILSNFLSPKKIIIDAIRNRLEGTGIIKMILYFNIKTDKYNVMLSNRDNGKMKLDIEQDDITKIKRIFVNRVQKKFEELSDKEIKAIIIDVNFDEDDIKIFIEDMKSNVELFNYKIL